MVLVVQSLLHLDKIRMGGLFIGVLLLESQVFLVLLKRLCDIPVCELEVVQGCLVRFFSRVHLVPETSKDAPPPVLLLVIYINFLDYFIGVRND